MPLRTFAVTFDCLPLPVPDFIFRVSYLAYLLRQGKGKADIQSLEHDCNEVVLRCFFWRFVLFWCMSRFNYVITRYRNFFEKDVVNSALSPFERNWLVFEVRCGSGYRCKFSFK